MELRKKIELKENEKSSMINELENSINKINSLSAMSNKLDERNMVYCIYICF